MLKKIILALAVLLLALQAVRPAKNLGEAEGPDALVTRHAVPKDVRAVLQKACYDCHSDRTAYPWYAEIQPVGWWLASHVNDGRRHLNFSSFGRYDAQRAAHKLDEIVDTVLARSMPLPSYAWVHRDAVLTPAEINAVADWAEALRDELAAK
jgi:hypothetical protein